MLWEFLGSLFKEQDFFKNKQTLFSSAACNVGAMARALVALLTSNANLGREPHTRRWSRYNSISHHHHGAVLSALVCLSLDFFYTRKKYIACATIILDFLLYVDKPNPNSYKS